MLSRTFVSLSVFAFLASAPIVVHPSQAAGAVAERASSDTSAQDAAALERHQRAVDAFNAHDADSVVDLYAANAVLHDPQAPEPVSGRDAIREAYAQMFRTFPDTEVTILSRHVTDGRMIYEARLTGTHEGPLTTPDGEVPATGRQIDLRVAVFADLDADGRFEETRRYQDIAAMMRQLGHGVRPR